MVVFCSKGYHQRSPTLVHSCHLLSLLNIYSLSPTHPSQLISFLRRIPSMGDHAMKKTTTTAAKPRMELEELYLGIPDESVNLTFQDLADLSVSEKRTKPPIITTVNEDLADHHSPSPLARLPSLDFNTGLQAPSNHHGHGHVGLDVSGGDKSWGHYGNYVHKSGGRSPVQCKGSGYDDDMSRVSTASGKGGGRRRRPGIPHSKICTVCSTYIYIFRTRCLVRICQQECSFSGLRRYASR